MKYKSKQLLIPVVFLFFIVTSAVVANPPQPGNWLMYFGNQKFSEKFMLHNEVQHRNYLLDGNLEQLMLRAGVGYDVLPWFNFLVGYAYIHSEPYSATGQKSRNSEDRIFQQAILKHKFGRLHVLNRFRFEQRILQGDFRLRARHFLAFNIPFNMETMSKGAIYLSLYNEIFLHTDESIFDRNRTYAALGFKPHEKIKVEAGLMTQFLENTDRTQIQFAVFNNLPFN